MSMSILNDPPSLEFSEKFDIRYNDFGDVVGFSGNNDLTKEIIERIIEKIEEEKENYDNHSETLFKKALNKALFFYDLVPNVEKLRKEELGEKEVFRTNEIIRTLKKLISTQIDELNYHISFVSDEYFEKALDGMADVKYKYGELCGIKLLDYDTRWK